jgi:hypothetical protein
VQASSYHTGENCLCQLRPNVDQLHEIRSPFKPSLIRSSLHGNENTTFQSAIIGLPILFTSFMSRPYLCSDPNLSDHSSSEGSFVSIFGFAVSAFVYLLSHGCERCEEALICRSGYRFLGAESECQIGESISKAKANGYLIVSSSRSLWSFLDVMMRVLLRDTT